MANRVVPTSSCSCTRYRDDVQQVSPLNESHWSNIEYCKQYILWYAYAKTIAEKEAGRIAREKGIDMVVVNPSFVVRPLIPPQPTGSLLLVLAATKSGKSLVGTVKLEFVLSSRTANKETHVINWFMTRITWGVPAHHPGFVHINDVVAAHILAMEEKRVSGGLICSGEVAHLSRIIEMQKAKYPQYPYERKCGSQKGDNNKHTMNASKITERGLPPFKSLEGMFEDCIRSFQEKGLL